MTDHDPLCPQHGQTMRSIIAFDIPCRCDLLARVRADERENGCPAMACPVRAARAEVAALTRWKAEATAVIEAWERVHALLGKPGFLGESKAEATWVEVRDLLDARYEAARDRDAARAELAEIDARIYGAAGIHRRNYAAERDLRLAREEVERLSAEIDRMVGELSSIRMEHEAEVAALREQIAAMEQRWSCQTCGQSPVWTECGNARCKVKVHPYCACNRDDEVDGHWCDDGCPSKALTDLRARVQAERDKHGPGRCGHCDALELVLDLIDKEADRG